MMRRAAVPILLLCLAVANLLADRRGIHLALRAPVASGGINSPSDISGLFVWLKADALMTNDVGASPPEPNGSIKGWGDSSGNNHAVFQPGTAYTAYRSNAQNSLPGIEASGSTWLRAGFSAQASTTTFVACKVTTAGGSFGFAVDTTNSASRQAIYKKTDDTISIYSGADVNDSSAPGSGALRVFCGTFNSGGNDTLYTNGVQAATGDAGAGALDGLIIGAANDGTSSWGAGGYIFEVVIYSRVLNSTEIGQVTTYLRNRWGF